MKILVACEESQEVLDAFLRRGNTGTSCDNKYPGAKGLPHYPGNVLDILYDWWDILIAHPPCTRLCNSGVCWLEKRGLWDDMREGAEFFRMLLNSPIKKKCLENPIPHKYALEIIGRKYDQIIQPWMFGVYESKATCLWLCNLPPLTPAYKTIEECREALGIPSGTKPEQRLHKLPPSPERARMRSRTYPCIADAMAEQWGSL